MRILIFIIFFLLLGAFFIISENRLVLSEKDSYKTFLYLYLDWVKNIASNFKEITGEVVRLEWLPKK